jgi:type I restriction enzyme, S subunit
MTALWDLPPGWRWSTFGEVATIASNLVSPADYPDHPHLAPNHVVPESGRHEPLVSVSQDGVTSSKHLFKPGQIIYSKIRPYLRKAVIARAEGLCSADMYPIETELDSRYLMWWMLSDAFTGMVMKGRSVIPKINQRELNALPVPVASMDEQVALVESIDLFISRIEAGQRSVLSALRRLEGLGASALQMLFVDASTGADTVPLDQIWESSRYGTSVKCDESGAGLPVLRIPNVRRRTIDLSDLKYAVDAEANLSPALVSRGDLLLIRTNGSRSLIGRVAAVPSLTEEFACASYLIRVRLDQSLARPEFVAACLEAPALRSTLESLAGSSAGQYNLSAAKLSDVRIPLPDLEVQDGLLERLSRHESILMRQTAAIHQVEGRSQGLRRSILKAAFAGRLLPSEQALSRLSIEQERVA